MKLTAIKEVRKAPVIINNVILMMNPLVGLGKASFIQPT
jgi:hypothetical protein